MIDQLPTFFFGLAVGIILTVAIIFSPSEWTGNDGHRYKIVRIQTQ